MDAAYKSVYRGDFLWPYVVPVRERPPKPPEESARKPLFIKEDSILERKMCQCDRHTWNAHFARAVHLKHKEEAFREAMVAVAQQRKILENEILDHPCVDSDDVLASLYQISYAKKNFPLTDYRAMHADHEDPIVTPIAMLRPTITSNYRDPTSFQHFPQKLPTQKSPADLSFGLSEVGGTAFPTTEYQDNIAKMALYNIFQSQSFKEPKTSAKLKPDCFCAK